MIEFEAKNFGLNISVSEEGLDSDDYVRVAELARAIKESMNASLDLSAADVFARSLGKTLSDYAPKATPLQIATTASVALAAFGMLAARRNMLANKQDEESWLLEVAGWLMTLIRGLLGAK